MEQYTANSNSSTEQIVVQAGQIQQQVWKWNFFKCHSNEADNSTTQWGNSFRGTRSYKWWVWGLVLMKCFLKIEFVVISLLFSVFRTLSSLWPLRICSSWELGLILNCPFLSYQKSKHLVCFQMEIRSFCFFWIQFGCFSSWLS